jgi:hypothetical protein
MVIDTLQSQRRHGISLTLVLIVHLMLQMLTRMEIHHVVICVDFGVLAEEEGDIDRDEKRHDMRRNSDICHFFTHLRRTGFAIFFHFLSWQPHLPVEFQLNIL